MNDFLKTIVSTGITLSLSDRESFVKSFSELLAEYQDDPKKADKWAKAIVDYVEQVRNNINQQSAFKSAVAEAGLTDQQKITELTKAIEELTGELRKFKDK